MYQRKHSWKDLIIQENVFVSYSHTSLNSHEGQCNFWKRQQRTCLACSTQEVNLPPSNCVDGLGTKEQQMYNFQWWLSGVSSQQGFQSFLIEQILREPKLTSEIIDHTLFHTGKVCSTTGEKNFTCIKCPFVPKSKVKIYTQITKPTQYKIHNKQLTNNQKNRLNNQKSDSKVWVWGKRKPAFWKLPLQDRLIGPS